MPKNEKLPLTLTEAQNQVRIYTVAAISDYTYSSSRRIPYFDLYRSRNSIMETPAQQIQRAAEDEKARAPRS